MTVRPGWTIDRVLYDSSSCRSHPRARSQCRWTDRSDKSRASAVSASLRPAKKRHSTTRARRGSSASRRSQGPIEGQQPIGLTLDRHDALVERERRGAAAALAGHVPSRVVDDDLPHGLRDEREEIAAVLHRDPVALAELEECLVHQRRRVQRPVAVRAAVGELAVRQPAELVVEGGKQPRDADAVAGGMRLQQCLDVRRHTHRDHGQEALAPFPDDSRAR
jgi:hypothetical protein